MSIKTIEFVVTKLHSKKYQENMALLVEFYLKNVLNLYFPYDVATTLLGIYSKEKKWCSNKPLYTDVHGYFIYNSQTVETPINRLVDKQVLYIHAM